MHDYSRITKSHDTFLKRDLGPFRDRDTRKWDSRFFGKGNRNVNSLESVPVCTESMMATPQKTMTQTNTLAEELEKMAGQCLAVRVRMINRAVSALYDECLRPYGLRISQGNLLVSIARREPVKPAEICRLLRIEKSTFSRDVEVLKRNGWLESDPPEGGRSQTLRVTPRGCELLRKVMPAWADAQKKTKQLIGKEGVQAVFQIADRIGFGSATK
jgi:DNA-binding MarR family transcriptional regulator